MTDLASRHLPSLEGIRVTNLLSILNELEAVIQAPPTDADIRNLCIEFREAVCITAAISRGLIVNQLTVRTLQQVLTDKSFIKNLEEYLRHKLDETEYQASQNHGFRSARESLLEEDQDQDQEPTSSPAPKRAKAKTRTAQSPESARAPVQGTAARSSPAAPSRHTSQPPPRTVVIRRQPASTETPLTSHTGLQTVPELRIVLSRLLPQHLNPRGSTTPDNLRALDAALATITGVEVVMARVDSYRNKLDRVIRGTMAEQTIPSRTVENLLYPSDI